MQQLEEMETWVDATHSIGDSDLNDLTDRMNLLPLKIRIASNLKKQGKAPHTKYKMIYTPIAVCSYKIHDFSLFCFSVFS